MSKDLILSKRFIQLSHVARSALSIAVSLSDDDGFFEIFLLHNLFNVPAECIDELVNAEFMIRCDDDIFHVNNIRDFKYIRTDRYKPSEFCSKFNISPLIIKEQKTKRLPLGNQMVTSEKPSGNHLVNLPEPASLSVENVVVEPKPENQDSETDEVETNKKKEAKKNNINNNIYNNTPSNFLKGSGETSLLNVSNAEITATTIEETAKQSTAKSRKKKKSAANVENPQEPKVIITIDKVATKLTESQALKELELFMGKHNELHGTNRKAATAMVNNWKTIRKTYTVLEILKSYENCVNSSFYSYQSRQMVYWREILKEDPLRFLRTRNDKGAVDPVGRFLEKPEIAQEPQTTNTLANNQFGAKHGSDYFKNAFKK